MPQIRCPSCGLTINLANRKAIDINLITGATRKKPRTFTELLHITRLPRKTLSLRLKELCTTGALVRNEHMYELNGASGFKGENVDSLKRFSRVFHNRKIRTGFIMVMLLACSSASGYALATFFVLSPVEEVSEGPVILGTFEMALDVNGICDLYTWQVAIVYDSVQLEVRGVVGGGFVGVPPLDCLNSTDSFEGVLFVGGSLIGEVPGKSGSGRLATITFGYFSESYVEPTIVAGEVFDTFLADAEANLLPIDEYTLTLTPIN